MWWIIIGILVVIAVVFGVVLSRQSAARHLILRRLKPGVKFKAHDAEGNVIIGQCVRIIDPETMEAVYRKESESTTRQGKLPTSRVIKVSS